MTGILMKKASTCILKTKQILMRALTMNQKIAAHPQVKALLLAILQLSISFKIAKSSLQFISWFRWNYALEEPSKSLLMNEERQVKWIEKIIFTIFNKFLKESNICMNRILFTEIWSLRIFSLIPKMCSKLETLA